MKLTRFNDILEDDEKIKGSWELTKDHEVQYKKDGKNEEVKLKASLLAAESKTLVLSLTERQIDQKIVTSIVKLSGSWRVDGKNRINFDVERESGKKDSLVFTGSWELGENHEIIYSYEPKNGLPAQSLVFQGYWDLSERNRLTYRLEGDQAEAFRFRGAFQTKSILAKKGEIRYQIGIEAKGKRQLQTIALFGKWKLSRKLDLSFEIEYQDGKRTLDFGGTYALGNGRGVTVNLKNEEGKPLGVQLILTKDLFDGNGAAFIRLEKSLAEKRIEAGMKFAW